MTTLDMDMLGQDQSEVSAASNEGENMDADGEDSQGVNVQ
jgi:hypothetical protein